MELKIVSSEIIKPSSPTPQHLRTHKLSVLDQVAGDSLFPVILFYPQACNNDTTKTSDHLKKSLSETLTKYYPFAGRFKDAFSIDCDDSGALFVEARVAGEMSKILKQPNNDLLEELMPYKLNEKPSVPVNLAAKVTYFGCSGMALCVCFSHVIADITTAANFIKSWVAISRGFMTSNDIPDKFFDCSTVFPLQDFSSFSRNAFADNHSQSAEIVTKRFTFHGVKLADLKEKFRKESSSHYQPTRVEAVSAVILGGIMSAEKEGEKFNHTNLVPSISVNLTRRHLRCSWSFSIQLQPLFPLAPYLNLAPLQKLPLGAVRGFPKAFIFILFLFSSLSESPPLSLSALLASHSNSSHVFHFLFRGAFL